MDTLEHRCNRNCSCTFVNFEPVCGKNDVMYFNPCAAGCLVVDEEGTAVSFNKGGWVGGGGGVGKA